MYDFYFGTKQQIKKKPEDFLLFVKRLLPRWANGIPDSECLEIFKTIKILKRNKNKKLTLIETGCGASSLAMFLHCALYGGEMYSWDINGSKGSFLRTIISETIGKALSVDANKLWYFLPCTSTDPNMGIAVLKELKKKADFCFFDSWHTLDQVMAELKQFEKIASPRFIAAFDDAYYTKKKINYTYINILRTKMGLKRIKEPANNKCEPFYIEIDRYLKKKYKKVLKIKDTYKVNYKNDIWFDYFDPVKDFGISAYDKKFIYKKIDSKQRNQLLHRFDAFIVG
jgi:hypothetical protein